MIMPKAKAVAAIKAMSERSILSILGSFHLIESVYTIKITKSTVFLSKYFGRVHHLHQIVDLQDISVLPR